MVFFRTTIILTLIAWIVFSSCRKNEEGNQLSHEDSVVQVMTEIFGNYRVEVTTEATFLSFPPVYDTLGIDTISILKIGGDSIEIENYYILPMIEGQPLDSSVIAFMDHSWGPQHTEYAYFFVPDDSISFDVVSSTPGGSDYTIYRGRKLN